MRTKKELHSLLYCSSALIIDIRIHVYGKLKLKPHKDFQQVTLRLRATRFIIAAVYCVLKTRTK
jgi:hypothetical protein